MRAWNWNVTDSKRPIFKLNIQGQVLDLTFLRNFPRICNGSICGWNLFQPLGLGLVKHRGFPANTRRSSNVGSMLADRRRRWANIIPTLFRWPVFVGLLVYLCKPTDTGFEIRTMALLSHSYHYPQEVILAQFSLSACMWTNSIHCILFLSQETRHIDPMLDQCWFDVVDGGSTLV